MKFYSNDAFSKLNKKIQIHFSEEMPMKIQYGLDNFMDDNEEEDDEDESKDKILFVSSSSQSVR